MRVCLVPLMSLRTGGSLLGSHDGQIFFKIDISSPVTIDDEPLERTEPRLLLLGLDPHVILKFLHQGQWGFTVPRMLRVVFFVYGRTGRRRPECLLFVLLFTIGIAYGNIGDPAQIHSGGGVDHGRGDILQSVSHGLHGVKGVLSEKDLGFSELNSHLE